MAKKIILFLSELNERNVDSKYACPDNFVVTGRLSNDAPVKYLIHKYDDVSDIICITSDEARKSGLSYFVDMVNQEKYDINVIDIDFHGEEAQQFINQCVSKIYKYVSTSDEILLETTGGFRNAVMYLLLISRILSYAGIPTVDAVYSNLKNHRVEELSHLVGMFDLVGGMQELSSFGFVKNIRKYYDEQKIQDSKISNLFDCVDELMECISLCRTGLIDEKMENFNNAIDMAYTCSDGLMRQLLPAFRNKFGEKVNIISLIRWCVESGMIQQALTMYTERIPAYIMKESGLIKVGKNVELPKCKEYEDPDAVLFLDGFLGMAKKSVDSNIVSEDKILRTVISDTAVLTAPMPKISKDVSGDVKKAISSIRTILNTIYTRSGNDINKQWKEKILKLHSDYKELVEWITENIAKDKEGMARRFSKMPKKLIPALMGKDVINNSTYSCVYENTIVHLEELIPESDYEITCEMEKIKKICNDYLYIKLLRNQTNHANFQNTDSQEAIVQYLKSQGYDELSQLSVKKIESYILQGLNNLEVNV